MAQSRLDAAKDNVRDARKRLKAAPKAKKPAKRKALKESLTNAALCDAARA